MARHICAKCSAGLSSEDTSCPECGNTETIAFAVDQTNGTKREQAEMELAKRHYEIEPGLTQISRITDKAEGVRQRDAQKIRLLEVNVNTVESGMMPLHFGPAPASGIPFSSIIVEVTPSELEKIRTHELRLPNGWEIGDELPRPTVNVEGN